jgi:hypothetical protein
MKFFENPRKGLAKTMLAFGLVSALGGVSLFATPVYTLGGLVSSGGTITIDDKTFSNFSWQSANAALNSDASALVVTASSSGGIDYLNWSGSIAVDNTLGNANLIGDLILKYTVSANPGSINMIDQSYTPLPATTAGSGQIIIGETVGNNGITVANSTLTLNPPVLSEPPAQPGDNLNINPSVQQLAVIKDISILAKPGNLVGLSNVEQSFHQVPVPEPSVTLIGSLGGGLLLLLRLRQAGRNVRKPSALS